MRIVIVGGPRCGKSTLAREYRKQGIPTFCGDPRSTVKDPEDSVTYLPEGISYAGDGGAGDWIARNWIPKPGPYVLEGHVMARALRRWMDMGLLGEPCDKIMVFKSQRTDAVTMPGQIKLHDQVMKHWNEIKWRFEAITEYR